MAQEHSIPRRQPSLYDGAAILDVGCATGRDLADPEFAGAAELCGIDVNALHIQRGKSIYPHLSLTTGRAEMLPYSSDYFDFVFCRLALPYMNVPVALREIARVLKPRGTVFFSLHDDRYQLHHWRECARRGEWRTVLDAPYILFASISCWLGLQVPPRPLKRTRTTFVPRSLVPWILRRAGFVNVSIERRPKNLHVRAVKL